MSSVPKNLNERRSLHFKELTRINPSVKQPGADVRPFYGVQSGGFTGKPYRYNVNSCSHIWLKVLSHNSKPLLSSSSASKASNSGSYKSIKSNPSSLRGERRSGDGKKVATGGRAERRSREIKKEKSGGGGGSPKRRNKSRDKVENPLTP